MPYAVELYFDDRCESRIRALWEKLATFGGPSKCDSGARPHVSLAVCESVDVSAARQQLDRFCLETAVFPISFSSLGVFATAEPILFLAPKVTPALLSLHSRFFAEFANVAQGCWPHYAPSQWVPHCTLATKFSQAKMGEISDIGQAAALPLTGRISEIGLVQFSPIKQLYAAFLIDG